MTASGRYWRSSGRPSRFDQVMMSKSDEAAGARAMEGVLSDELTEGESPRLTAEELHKRMAAGAYRQNDRPAPAQYRVPPAQPPEEVDDPLWDVKQIADFLGKGEQWVYRSSRKYGLDMFDIGGNNLRARRSEVYRFAFRNSLDPAQNTKAYLAKDRSKRR